MGKLKHILDKVDNAARAVAKQADEAARIAAEQADNAALDMSQAARMARASEQGFDTGNTWYHGTIEDLNGRFDPARRGSNTGANGAERAFWFADSKPNAGFYIDYANAKREAEGLDQVQGNIYEVYLGMRNPLVLDPVGGTSNVPDDLVAQLIDNDPEALDYAKYNGFDGVVWPHGNMNNAENTAAVFDPAKIRSVDAKFDPANIGKNDLMGSIDPRLLAPTAAAAGIGVAAQNYDYGTPEIDAAYQKFAERRASKKGIWDQLKSMGEFGATLGSAIGGGIVADASRLGGYLNPFMSTQETEQGAQAIESSMQYVPGQPNAMLDQFGHQMNKFTQDIQPLTDAVQQSIPYKAYEALPDRAKGIVDIGLNYAF